MEKLKKKFSFLHNSVVLHHNFADMAIFPFPKNNAHFPKNDAEMLLFHFWEAFWENGCKPQRVKEEGGFARMRKKNFKGRCEKRKIPKCEDVCRTYDPIQYAYADLLAADDEVQEIRCNVLLDGLEEGEYTTDFVCTKTDGDLMVRECVYRKFLMKPMTVKLLDASREYWLRHGVTDWGLVIDEEA